MKTIVILFSVAFLVPLTGLLPIGGNAPAGANDSGNKVLSSSEKPSWEIPIAAGVWYPSDGPLPDNPMRYYRVRCWPGCHTGSNYGKYPQKALNDTPIFPTSAAGAHPVVPTVKE
jgi:hypothetical protein